MALFWHKCLCELTGPWKGVSAAGRARRSLSVIQNFKMSCRGQFNEKEFFFMKRSAPDIGDKLLEPIGDTSYNVL